MWCCRCVWWQATCQHVRRLPDPASLPRYYRHAAELWLGVINNNTPAQAGGSGGTASSSSPTDPPPPPLREEEEGWWCHADCFPPPPHVQYYMRPSFPPHTYLNAPGCSSSRQGKEEDGIAAFNSSSSCTNAINSSSSDGGSGRWHGVDGGWGPERGGVGRAVGALEATGGTPVEAAL